MYENKHDIQTKEDVELMVNTFYEKVNKDEMLSYIFNDYSHVDWETHLPKMYRFWNSLLFAERSYKGNPFASHLGLPVDKRHFDRWVELFVANIDEHFAGTVAEQTKTRAKSIAYVFQTKLAFLNQNS